MTDADAFGMDVDIERDREYVCCRPLGELDAYTVGRFRDALAAVAGAPKLVIDLTEVAFIDSAGLNALVGGVRRVRENGGDVAIACGRPALLRLLHTTGFDRVVVVEASVGGAADALLLAR